MTGGGNRPAAQHLSSGHRSADLARRTTGSPATRVHVESDLYGLDLGAGLFGGDDATSDVTTGRNQMVLADAPSHRIVVQRDGQKVASYPASFGSGDVIGDPNRVTRSGIRDPCGRGQAGHHLMSNPAYGYTAVIEHWRCGSATPASSSTTTRTRR